MSTCADVESVIGSKTSVVQTSNVGFTSEVSDYLVVHTGAADGLLEQYDDRTVSGDILVRHIPVPPV